MLKKYVQLTWNLPLYSPKFVTACSYREKQIENISTTKFAREVTISKRRLYMQRCQLNIPLRDTMLAKISLNLGLVCRYGDHDSWRMIHDHSKKENRKDAWIKVKNVSWFSRIVLTMESQSNLWKVFCSSELPSEAHSHQRDFTSACSI